MVGTSLHDCVLEGMIGKFPMVNLLQLMAYLMVMVGFIVPIKILGRMS